MPAAPPSGPEDRRAGVRALSDLLPRFLRLAHASRAQLAGDGRERAARVLLVPIARLGPLRQGALAELVHADPSTVSRHVATLVEQGLVRRVADTSGGRVSRLSITEAGHCALHELYAERESRLEQVTAGWDDADLATLTRLFGRLLDDLEAHLPGGPPGCEPDASALPAREGTP